MLLCNKIWKSIPLLILAFILPLISVSQRYSRVKSNNTYKNWAFEAQVGVVSYFGDLSIYDDDIVNKLSQESGPAFGGAISKYFGDYFGLGGELIYGQLKAQKNEQTFNTTIIEYNGQAFLDVLNIFVRERKLNFGILLYAGLGNILFTANYKNDQIDTEYRTSVPEFLYFVGGKVVYHPTLNLRVSLSASLRQLQNDNLDATTRNSDFDYYSYVNLGLAYKLNKKVKRKGNSRLNSIKRRR